MTWRRAGRLRRLFCLGLLVSASALAASACGSSSSGTQSGSAAPSTQSGGSSATASTLKQYESMPQKILEPSIGLKPFKPKPNGYIYNISCDLSIPGCNENSTGVEQATKAIGYKFSRCNAGSSPSAPDQCFTNAINAKPSAIVINAVGKNVAAAGYAAAKKAGIPVVGLFTGDTAATGVANVQVGGADCYKEGVLTADAIANEAGDSANVLFATEKSIACDIQRQSGFQTEFPKVCPKCTSKLLLFDASTIQTSLPQQLQASLNADPGINWIVGVFDAAASIAVTQVQQAGKNGQVSVAGMDADPANVGYLLKKEVQRFDLAFAMDGSASWSAVDAAARIYSGQKVPATIPTSIYLLTQNNASSTGPQRIWHGPPGYQNQYKSLWEGR